MDNSVTRTARTVEEAEELALKELGVDRNEVEVEVLSRGKVGFLGLGAELARVKVTLRGSGAAAPSAAAQTPARRAPVRQRPAAEGAPPSGDAATLALDAVTNILSAAKVNVNSTLRSASDADAGGPVIDLSGEDSGLLIGRRGQTLQALQFLVTAIVRAQHGETARVVLDVEGYRNRREVALRDMAAKVAERVVQTGRSISLEPMSPADRRIIHTALTDHPGVTTESFGVGEGRKVTILPKRRQ
jgi:spoIIIJ-associated protein